MITVPPTGFRTPLRVRKGFSLVELLVVISLLAAMSALIAPALSSLRGASAVTKAITDLSVMLELARAHAMAHNTYVRVAFADMGHSGNSVTPSTVVLAFYSATSVLPGSDMEDTADWPALTRPLVFNNFSVDDALNASAPDTSADGKPSDWRSAAVERKMGQGSVTFRSFIQFSPSGEARVNPDAPVRHIKIAMQNRQQPDRNPFILRLSGMNGNLKIIRKGAGID